MAEILHAPSAALSEESRPLSAGEIKDLSPLLNEMEKALREAKDPKGVGLAAPQIGKSLSIFITKASEKALLKVFINPQVLETEPVPLKDGKMRKKVKKLEGCLSIPNIWGEVVRYPSVILSFTDEKGKKRTNTYKGFMATIIQHEMDHLKGVLFPSRVLKQKGKLYKSFKNEEGQDEFEEISI